MIQSPIHKYRPPFKWFLLWEILLLEKPRDFLPETVPMGLCPVALLLYLFFVLLEELPYFPPYLSAFLRITSPFWRDSPRPLLQCAILLSNAKKMDFPTSPLIR